MSSMVLWGSVSQEGVTHCQQTNVSHILTSQEPGKPVSLSIHEGKNEHTVLPSSQVPFLTSRSETGTWSQRSPSS